MSLKYPIPRPNAGPLDPRNSRFTTEWFNYLRSLGDVAGDSASAEQIAAIEAAIAGLRYDIEHLPSNTLIGVGSIKVSGSQISLAGDADDPGQGFLYGTDSTGTKGWFRVFDVINADPDDLTVTDSGYVVLGEVSTPADLPLTGNAGEAWRVVDEDPGLYGWDGAAFTLDTSATGVVGLALADVPDSGTGTLQATAFDAKGRKTGTQAVTTDDLAEGTTHLYFADSLADARIDAWLATLASLPNAVDDTAAAGLGVAVGAMYRNGSILMVRIT